MDIFEPFEPLRRNPWLTIWTQPRATMREILDTRMDQVGFMLVLSMLGGIANAYDQANQNGYNSFVGGWLAVIVGGAIAGLISYYLFGWLLKVAGRWVGGEGTTREVRAALAWANVPLIWLMLFWIPDIILYGENLFIEDAHMILVGEPLETFFKVVLGAIQLVFGIWTLIIFLKCMGEAHRISAWAALGALLLLAILIILVIFVPILFISMAL